MFNTREDTSCIYTDSYIDLLSSGLETELPHFSKIQGTAEVKDNAGFLTWPDARLYKRLALGLGSVEKDTQGISGTGTSPEIHKCT